MKVRQIAKAAILDIFVKRKQVSEWQAKRQTNKQKSVCSTITTIVFFSLNTRDHLYFGEKL